MTQASPQAKTASRYWHHCLWTGLLLALLACHFPGVESGDSAYRGGLAGQVETMLPGKFTAAGLSRWLQQARHDSDLDDQPEPATPLPMAWRGILPVIKGSLVSWLATDSLPFTAPAMSAPGASRAPPVLP